MRLFVDNLSNVDFSYLDPKRGLVGETWLASIELIGELDEQGMVCDFGIVKSMLRKWLDTEIDHRLLVPARSAALSRQACANGNHIQWQQANGELICECPDQAVAFIDAETITPTAVANWCIAKLKSQFPGSVKSLKLHFAPESISGPFYHYSHGLKKHDGNCQRIAHGHRSPINIWKNGELSVPAMEAWAQRWQDIYIGTRSDISDDVVNPANQGFRYQAQQGEFYLELPKENCYLMDSDTTIEFIAQHIANTLKTENPQDNFEVKAFEGLAKGAIATA